VVAGEAVDEDERRASDACFVYGDRLGGGGVGQEWELPRLL